MHRWNYEGISLRDRKIVFVDFDGLLPDLDNAETNKEDMEEAI